MTPLVEVRGVSKIYVRDDQELPILQELDLTIAQGEFLALMGPSGSGKTTLLNLLAGLDAPSGGSIRVAGEEIAGLSQKQLAAWRSRHVGFIFQLYNLIPVLTALQNVELPLLLTKLNRKERREHAETALRIVGLEDRMDHFPRQLSGGQEQRVGIARAIVTDPTIILADEPTGDLDAKSAQEILELLSRLNTEFDKTIVMVTHDPHAAEQASRTLHLEKGALLEQGAGRLAALDEIVAAVLDGSATTPAGKGRGGAS
jgi:putative ABC transport system ATP-binding protein